MQNHVGGVSPSSAGIQEKPVRMGGDLLRVFPIRFRNNQHQTHASELGAGHNREDASPDLGEALAVGRISSDDQFALKLVGQIILLGDLRRHTGEALHLLLHAPARERRHHHCSLDRWLEGCEIEPNLGELDGESLPNSFLLAGTFEESEHR